MNGIDKITSRIETDARVEAEAILREGEANAARIRKEYEDQAAAQSSAAEAAGRQAAEDQYERLVSAARMDGKKLLLETKQQCLDEAFAAARQRLLDLDVEAYADLLSRVAAKAAKTGREEIILNDRDRRRVGDKVVAKANALLAQANAPELPRELKSSKAGSLLNKVVAAGSAILQGTALLTLSQETREMDGGLILREGNVEINCAFETQLRLLRGSMAAEVAGILFPQ